MVQDYAKAPTPKIRLIFIILQLNIYMHKPQFKNCICKRIRTKKRVHNLCTEIEHT